MASFRANGKLLLTAEYVVLLGCRAIALPLKYGQTLQVLASSAKVSSWKSYDREDKLWYSALYDPAKQKWISEDDKSTTDWLNRLFTNIRELEEGVEAPTSYDIKIKTEFDSSFGWGTSSTLVSLLAQWKNIDPFALGSKTFGGSLYDIACAQSAEPIEYRLENGQAKFKPVPFNPSFKASIYFIYLGKKVNSREALKGFDKSLNYQDEIQAIEAINNEIIRCTQLESFISLITEHEKIMSSVLNLPTVKMTYFSDFQGGIKSMGAWGGDFILAVSERPYHYVKSYFEEKNLSTFFTYQEIISSNT